MINIFLSNSSFRHTNKRFLRRVKHAVLVCAIQPLKRAPYFGKRFRHNASAVHFRREPIKFFGFHGFEGVSFLFISDLHIGGNIDHIADHISQGIHGLLKHAHSEHTYVLHGGDFISSIGKREHLSYEHFTHIATKLFRGLESSKHFAVVGNHDEESPEFPVVKQWLEETYEMHFFTEPRHAKKIFIGERNICIHGIHTLAKHLHTMKKRDRNMLLDQYIYTLNSMHNDLNIVLLHNPDGLEFLLARLKSTGQTITTPTLFLAGHTHGG